MGRLLLLLILLPLAGLMLFCLAAWLSRKVRGCSVWTLPRGVLVALAALAIVAVDFAQKGGAPSVPPSPVPPPLPMGVGPGVTNSILITSIVPTPSNVTLSAEWPEGLAIPGTLDVFFSPTLTNLWEWIGEVNVPSGATNLTFIAEAADLPGAPDAMPPMGFFRLGSFADTDGDGLDDTVETGDFAFVAGFPQFYPLPDEDSRLGWRVFTAEDPPDMVRMPLPLPFAVSNDLFVAFSVDTCGLVHLYTNATDLAYAPYLPNRDLSREGVLDSALTIAPLWAPLAFGTQSVVRVYQSVGGMLNIEYDRMLPAGTPDTPENEVSVQVRIRHLPNSWPVAEIRYVQIGEDVCAAASIGFRSPGGRWRQTYSFHGSRMFTHGVLDLRLDSGLGTDPHLADTDGDGVTDGDELAAGTDQCLADTDGDGLSDGAEINLGTDPRQPDTDGDGMNDGWEVAQGLDPTVDNATDSDPGNDADADPDGDGLTNAEESAIGSNPYVADTDGDGLGDAQEAAAGSNPNSADTDGDGLGDTQEVTIGTSPTETDTDGDGISDSDEIAQGTSPTDGGDAAPVRWVVLTGNEDEGVTATLVETVTLLAGRTYLVGVFIASEEYPHWTGTQSDYNDRLTWSVSAAGMPTLSGDIRVNNEDGAWGAAAGAGQTVNGFSPVVFKDRAVYMAPTNSAMPVSVSLTATNVRDDALPSTVMVGFFPLDVIQANMPRPSGVAGMTDSGAARIRATIRRGGVAYITGEPAAPQLTAQFKGLPPWIRVTWGLSLVSERTERRNDDDRSTAAVEIGGASVYAITAELHNEVVGGLCTLHVQPAGVTAVDYRFSIRGKNPPDATARAYITANVDATFQPYAWMIAKHESRHGSLCYNQFNPVGSKKALPNKTVRGNGWGIAQIDKGRDACTTAEVYDWHTNVVSMNVKLREGLGNFNRFVRYFRELYANDPSTMWFEPDGVTTNVAGYTVSAETWSVLTFYNGTQGCPEVLLDNVIRQVPVEFDPVTTNWIFHVNSKNYVHKVFSDRNEREIE